jgi:hypothetical protein
MIVGYAAILQGNYEASTGTRLSPGQMRALLSDPAMRGLLLPDAALLHYTQPNNAPASAI